MSEPTDDWTCKFNESPVSINLSSSQSTHEVTGSPEASGNGKNDFTFPSRPLVAEDDDEDTESKIRAFLDEKVSFVL